MNKKIALIGGSGFIGSALKNYYAKSGCDIVSYEIGSHDSIHDSLGMKTIFSSYKNASIDVSHLIGCNYVFYLIGGEFKLPLSYLDQFQNSLSVFENFLNDITSLSVVPKIIFFSSAGTVYGSSKDYKTESDQLTPFGSYGIIKSTMESILIDFSKNHQLKNLILRVSNPYGIGQIHSAANGFIVNVLKNYFNENPIRLSKDLEIYRDYIFIDDLCDVIFRLTDSDAEGVFNVSSGTSYSLNEILGFIQKAGILFENDIVDYIKPSVKYNFVSNKKLLYQIGNFDFRPIDVGIADIISFFQNNPKI
jgi:UDP-glucose 4-epimerase